MSEYDVIIVGGRVAGSTLAARLGQQGLRVLILERDRFPRPHPASSPMINSRAMFLLDEIGADEKVYAAGTPQSRRYVYEIRDAFRVFNRVPEQHGRDYGLAVDRARFDEALWNLALQLPTVEGHQGCAVQELIWHDGRVAGVRVRHQGQEQTYTADCVVGADGRFSLVARQVQAREFRRVSWLPTSVLYAYWENVAPYDQPGEPVIHFISPEHGLGILMIEAADGRTAVVVEGQSKKLKRDGLKSRELYLEILQSCPAAWRRLRHGHPATRVHGMRKVGNLYRQAGGPGWALTGDALHQKDSVDGQGIHDAIFISRQLASAIVSWKKEGQSWSQALLEFEKEVITEMQPMYVATILTVLEDFYLPLPQWVFDTVVRWLFEDEVYRRRLALLLARGLPNAARWRPLPVILKAIGRGFGRDIKRLIRRESRPSQVPSYGEFST